MTPEVVHMLKVVLLGMGALIGFMAWMCRDREV